MADSLAAVCLHCGQRFTYRADQLGQEHACPHCKRPLVVGAVPRPTANRAADFSLALTIIAILITCLAPMAMLALSFERNERAAALASLRSSEQPIASASGAGTAILAGIGLLIVARLLAVEGAIRERG